MPKPDAYYGEVAEGYDASRSVKPKWHAEIAAVDEMLDSGPVLDVPLGTGRFVPICRRKGLHVVGIDISGDMLGIALKKFPDVDARRGSAFDLPFTQNEFATAICIRFLEWLPLDLAHGLLRSLGALANILIVSINHGIEGQPDAYTYDLGKFLAGIDGLLIERRRVTANVKGITSEVFKLRPARWSDVTAQFRHEPEGADAAIQRIADKHGAFFGLAAVPVQEATTTVRAEHWAGERIENLVQSLADHRFVTDKDPRRNDGRLIVLERAGRELMIDGRHRANAWMKTPGPHPVLIVSCSES